MGIMKGNLLGRPTQEALQQQKAFRKNRQFNKTQRLDQLMKAPDYVWGYCPQRVRAIKPVIRLEQYPPLKYSPPHCGDQVDVYRARKQAAEEARALEFTRMYIEQWGKSTLS